MARIRILYPGAWIWVLYSGARIRILYWDQDPDPVFGSGSGSSTLGPGSGSCKRIRFRILYSGVRIRILYSGARIGVLYSGARIRILYWSQDPEPVLRSGFGSGRILNMDLKPYLTSLIIPIRIRSSCIEYYLNGIQVEINGDRKTQSGVNRGGRRRAVVNRVMTERDMNRG